MPAVVTLGFLSFVQAPFLGLLYCCNGGGSNPLLPPGYISMLLIVAVTWLGFPAWWFLSYEGMGILKDTKSNAVGFAVLNVISKGTLSFHVMRMVQQSKKNAAARGDREAARELGAVRERAGSCSSMQSGGSGDPSEVKAALSVTAWLVRFLRNFDDGVKPGEYVDDGTGSGSMSSGQGGDKWERQGTGDSTRSTTTGPDHDMGYKPDAKLWDGLEPMYKRFLREAGVTAESFERMSVPEKVDVREKFDKVAGTVFKAQGGKQPGWAAQGSMTLAEASDKMLLAELRRRLEMTVNDHPLYEKPSTKYEKGISHYGHQDKVEIDMEVDTPSGGTTPRRAYQV
jgi:hypothetical protein